MRADISKVQRVWVTGAPGSKYSGVSQRFMSLPNTDLSDIRPSRVYTIPQAPERPFHIGAYFDPGGEHGNHWLDFTRLSEQEILDEIDDAWGKPHEQGTIRVIKSHMIGLHIQRIKRTWPNDIVILVKRPLDKLWPWWSYAGGFDIKHPRYEWFRNQQKMEYWQAVLNKAVEAYVDLYNGTWEDFDEQFLAGFGITEESSGSKWVPLDNGFKDVKVAVI
jgi:hypothetical protein